MQWIAALLGVGCVGLAVRRSVWNYPLGIASVTLLGIVFWDARLYSDALLQGFYVAVNLWGWRHWRSVAAEAGEVVVETLSGVARLRWLAACVVATALWGWGMHRFTDAAYPWPDAAIAIASVAAQLLMARRYVENWAVWIAVDVASIPLYAAKELGPTMILYLVYLALAIWGYADWRRARRGAGRDGGGVPA